MQENNTNPVPNADAAAANLAASKAAQSDFLRKIVEKTKKAENILIALSKDPSVDDIAAAIGLTLYLSGMGKHVTAIYSGHTPDELSFLQPNETFEKNTDSLQDFIVSLNKDKADHLRYKLEGDFVKVFITPYKARLNQDDLEFSYGDYNVDFVIAIDVPASMSLDNALHEHGRILHDASVVDITTNAPGKFGEIEWSNPMASSVCEMVTELIFALQDDEEKKLEQDVATALLTGIVAATDRFSNNRTNSDTMSLASKLMSMGADQQLITANVHGNDVMHNDAFEREPGFANNVDTTNLMIDHEAEQMPNQQDLNTNINPAVQAAPELNNTEPEPATMVSATNNVMPEDVIVQPVIPGGAGVSAPENSTAILEDDATSVIKPEESVSEPMMSSTPDSTLERQYGTPIEPPTPVENEEKNYAEMMTAALAETPNIPTITGPIATPEPVTPAPDVKAVETEKAKSTSDDTPVEMEPVAKPDANILPPPPVPDTGTDIMPPVLPKVQ